jgi:transposase-like protein
MQKMNYALDPDPMETTHDKFCPGCDSTMIEFVKDLGLFSINIMWEGKICQRVKKSLWLCDDCGRTFSRNHFITQ